MRRIPLRALRSYVKKIRLCNEELNVSNDARLGLIISIFFKLFG